MFILQLGFLIESKLNEVDHGTYKNPYSLILKDDYRAYDSYAFLTRNSSYTFLLDNRSKTAVVIPHSAIRGVSCQIDAHRALPLIT